MPNQKDEYKAAEDLRVEIGLPDTDGGYSVALDEVRRRRQKMRRKHSRDGRVRCDICSPLRCWKAK